MNSGAGKKKETWITVSNIIIAALSIVFAITGFNAISKYHDYHYRYHMEARNLMSDAKMGRYIEMVHYRDENIMYGYTIESDKEYAIPYAIADYTEAAFWYKVYQNKGDATKMNEQLEAMSDAHFRMKDAKFMADDINQKLGLDNCDKLW